MGLGSFLPLRHADDPAVQAELECTPSPEWLPHGVEIQWLGTAGFRLACEGVTILVDPFVTRSSLPELMRARPLLSDPGLVDRWLPSADAVLVGHTHFDHAVDVAPLVARGATAYGSTSLKHLLDLHDLGDHSVEVAPHRRYEIGPFRVTFVPSRHSRMAAGVKVIAGGELTCDALDHLGVGKYRCGQVWGVRIEVAGVTLYHQGSADLIDDEVPDGGVDVLLCGIAGRGFTPRFVQRCLAAFDPGVIGVHHHDDFFRPIADEMGFSLNVNLGGFVADVERLAPGMAVESFHPMRTYGAER